MLVGVFTDAHSDVDALALALAQAADAGAERFIVLGDVLECHLPKGYAGESVPFDVATTWSDRFETLLAGTDLISGNQEERIAAGSIPESIPPYAQTLLHAPVSRSSAFAHYEHGHRFSWTEMETDRWVPVAPALPGRVVVHGHHHRNSLLAVRPETEGGPRSIDLTPRSGKRTHLDPDVAYILNVGAAHGPSPSWALLDEDARNVTLHYTQKRFVA